MGRNVSASRIWPELQSLRRGCCVLHRGSAVRENHRLRVINHERGTSIDKRGVLHGEREWNGVAASRGRIRVERQPEQFTLAF